MTAKIVIKTMMTNERQMTKTMMMTMMTTTMMLLTCIVLAFSVACDV